MSKEIEAQSGDSPLVALLEKNCEISKGTAVLLSTAFSEFYDQAQEWNKKAKEYLTNTELSQEEKSKECRKGRLALVKVRTGIDKKRKELNEGANLAISNHNKAAKLLTELVSPTEALLDAEEKKQENIEKEKREKIKQERLSQLEPLGVDCTFFDLANMPEEAFSQLLENSKLAAEKRIEDEKKAAEIEEKARIENERIQKEQEAKRIEEETRLKAEKDAAERKAALLEQEKKEKEEAHQVTISRLQSLVDVGLKISYDNCQKLSDQEYNDLFIKQKSEYEAEQNRLFIERKKKEREDALEAKRKEDEAKAKREAELAPDKTKLEIAIMNMNYECSVNSKEALEVNNLILEKFNGFKKWAIDQVSNLK